MPWPFVSDRRKRSRQASSQATGSRAQALIHRRWSLRFEDAARLALADLADLLAALRASRDEQQRALCLAGTRDALDRIEEASRDPAVGRACQLFGQILGAPSQSVRQRLDTAALALETLTFMVIADDQGSRERAALAMRQLEQAARQAEAA
ncbi:MAG TPA: hypothetical protein VJL84_12890 [Kiloniellales bacterium]|nr:hypothetical protein [Kiloniellales bacterium]